MCCSILLKRKNVTFQLHTEGCVAIFFINSSYHVSQMFSVLQLNHFPGSFQIGRKDRLWRNLSKMQTRFGKQEFGFFPRSFVLPQDMKLLKKAWEDGGSRQKWIIKPVLLGFLDVIKLF